LQWNSKSGAWASAAILASVRIVTWNVNSVRQRLPRLLALLARHEPDVVCLQETKVTDDDFPFDEVSAAGYGALSSGQRAYNGVAILSRHALEEVSRGMPDDPVPDEARLLAARTGGLAVATVYAVNGKSIEHPAYATKLAWFDAMRVWAMETFTAGEPLLLAGDFNVAPDDRDVHDPALWRGKNLASDPERARIAALEALGLTDLGRAAAGDVEGPFTWWDYRMGAFHRGWGLRIDLLLGSAPVAERLLSVSVDREERKPTSGEGKPSDHAPVVLTLSDA
jgi:exodeoxyribonuclease-3